MSQGAVVGALTVVGFAVAHAIWISDIWFNIVPMVISGALCGLCIVWSFRTGVDRPSARRWLAYSGACAVLLLALGGASLLIFEPRFTMLEILGADDPLRLLMPPALPLMAVGTVVGGIALWATFGLRHGALGPIIVCQALLMFLLGHNLAILGLVEVPAEQLYRVGTFIGLTGFLAVLFAVGTLLVTWGRSRLARRLATAASTGFIAESSTGPWCSVTGAGLDPAEGSAGHPGEEPGLHRALTLDID
jgi:hypothetical protein